MSRNLKILIVMAVLLIVVVVVGLMATFAASPRRTQEEWPYFQREPTVITVADLQAYYMARTVISTINISLLLVLVITYASIFLKTRSEFTIGLLIFAMVFLLKDIASSPLILGMFGYGLFGLGPFVPWFFILPDLFELVALSVLLYLSVKY
jgi:hypothetical protein